MTSVYKRKAQGDYRDRRGEANVKMEREIGMIQTKNFHQSPGTGSKKQILPQEPPEGAKPG